MRTSQGSMFWEHLHRSVTRKDVTQFETESAPYGYKVCGLMRSWKRDAHVGIER